MSAHEAIADFIHAMECEGVKALEPIAQRLSSGELIRFRCDGDGKGRQNGWAILYLDEKPAGAFGNYRLGLSRKWRVDRDLSLSPEERRKLSAEWAEATCCGCAVGRRTTFHSPALVSGAHWRAIMPARS